MTHPQGFRGFRGFVFSLPSSFHLKFISNHCLQNVPRTPSFGNSLEFKRKYNKQAKSQCRPSSLEISSLDNVKPGINPLFLSQKIAQKLPEKKNTFHASKRDDSFSERIGGVDPPKGPICFLHHTGDRVDGAEERILLEWNLYACFEEEAVHFGVDILDRDLESVECASFGDLHF